MNSKRGRRKRSEEREKKKKEKLRRPDPASYKKKKGKKNNSSHLFLDLDGGVPALKLARDAGLFSVEQRQLLDVELLF